jgi:hypothetical protein
VRIRATASPRLEFWLEPVGFVMQSHFMNPHWAEENLQTIRTLMERSALYRRALAPIMLFAGTAGVLAAAIGLWLRMDSARAFGTLWLGTAMFVLTGSFLIARRQAIKDKETFWSPPTRRVAHALSLPLAIGMFLSLLPVFSDAPFGFNSASALIWILFYGCALHSAGFFMPRGIKYFGLFFSLAALGIFFAIVTGRTPDWLTVRVNSHWLMGFFFGVLHWACGVYLYFTEKKSSAA